MHITQFGAAGHEAGRVGGDWSMVSFISESDGQAGGEVKKSL